jgi:hypothetical protein
LDVRDIDDDEELVDGVPAGPKPMIAEDEDLESGEATLEKWEGETMSGFLKLRLLFWALRRDICICAT